MNPAIKRLSEQCVSYEYDGLSNREYSILFQSDQHFDSVDCNRDLLNKHLTQVKDMGSTCFMLGDLFDGMGTQGDRRGSKSTLRPELKQTSYLNALVDEAVKLLTPYANNIAAIARGNHEETLLKYTEFDVLSATIQRLNTETGSNIIPMGYTGWIFLRPLRKRHTREKTNPIKTIKIAYTHGHTGGVVTRGVLGVNRKSLVYPDANIIISGHLHESWQMEICRNRITKSGNVNIDSQWHCQLPTYKQNPEDGRGWEHMKGFAPRPLGGYWLDLSYVMSNSHEIEFNLRRAL